jgi:TolB-like protein
MSFSAEESDFYEFGRFRLEPAARRLTDVNNKSPVSISPKSFDLLLLLVRNKTRLVTKEMIFEHLWGERFVEENNLTVRVSELRKALGEHRGNEKFIETVSGNGYRFIAEVRNSIKLHSLLKNRVEVSDSLAVLPFVNESSEADLDYLADGITESIINNLSQLPQLKVISHNTAFGFKGEETNLRQIGELLGVQAILTGRILQISENFILSVELIDSTNNLQIWGARFRYQSSDIFEMQEKIAKEVAAGLRLKLTENEKALLAKRYTENTEVYHLYLKGRYFWNKRNINETKKAIKYFEEAIENDPAYALAYSGLADCFIMFFMYGGFEAKNTIPKAEAAISKALEIADYLPEAHTSLACIRAFYNWNWVDAVRQFKRSIELNNNYAPAHYWYACCLAIMGRFEEALFEIKQAQQIDPLSFMINKTESKILYLSRQYDKAINKCFEILEMDPNFGPANAILAQAYLEKQMYREAIFYFTKLIEYTSGFKEYELPDADDKQSFSEIQRQLFSSKSDPEAIAAIGYVYAITGKRNEALQIAQRLENLSKQIYIEPHALALIHTALRNKDQAFIWLEKAFAEHSATLPYLNVWAMFDGLRFDPRFKNLMQRIGLTPV